MLALFNPQCVLGLSSGRVQGSGNLRLAVQLPDGEDTNEWLAVHGVLPMYLTSNFCPFTHLRLPAVDFFNHLNMLYGTITEFCTPQEVRSRSMFGMP